MSQSLFKRAVGRVTRKGLLRLLATVVSILIIQPAWADATVEDQKDDETLKKTAAVLQEMLSRHDVAMYVLAKADCIIVLPGVKKFSIGIGGSGGGGAMSCRTGANFTGPWSAPALYSIGGASVGLQLGGSSTDFVLLLMSDKGVDVVLKGKTKLGSRASVGAGPSGATTTSGVGASDVLSYGRTSGLFAGVSLGGATLEPDNKGNKNLYGRAITASEIVLANAVQTPAAGQPLISLLNSKVAEHSK